MDRDPNRPGLVGDGATHRLSNPPRCIGREFIAALILKFLNRAHQADIALLDQVQKSQPAVDIAFGNTHHEAQIGFNETTLAFLRLGFSPRDRLQGLPQLFTIRAKLPLKVLNSFAGVLDDLTGFLDFLLLGFSTAPSRSRTCSPILRSGRARQGKNLRRLAIQDRLLSADSPLLLVQHNADFLEFISHHRNMTPSQRQTIQRSPDLLAQSAQPLQRFLSLCDRTPLARQCFRFFPLSGQSSERSHTTQKECNPLVFLAGRIRILFFVAKNTPRFSLVQFEPTPQR